MVRRLHEFGAAPAIVHHNRTTRYSELAAIVPYVCTTLREGGIGPGHRVLLIGDYGTLSSALLLACIALNVIVIPLTPVSARRKDEYGDICAAEWVVQESRAQPNSFTINRLDSAEAKNATHPLFAALRSPEVPGLVLFTSGSTGTPKAVVHDFSRLLEKFKKPGKPLRTLNFLLFDHWGGLNTLFHTLCSGGLIVCPESRNPDHVCDLIERHEVELLPTSPSFLNMMLVSGAHRRHDLASLRLVTYGAEPMLATTLQRLNEELPGVEFRQTYGLIELGVLRAKSAGSDSLLVKIGGEGYDVRVVNDMLEIKARSSMLGYLNAPSPFTPDGYFQTGDRVEQVGEYFRILGRQSEQINVGGEKVFPAEVEEVLLSCPIVADAVVYGERHPMSGKIVCADVVPKATGITASEIRTQIRLFCNGRMESFKVPVKIKLVEGPLTGDRLKRTRIGRADEQS